MSDMQNEELPDRDHDAPARGRLLQLARHHPALSVLGAAGLGLFGGVELAAGVLLGAGVLAVLRGDRGTSLRDRARAIVDRASPQVRERVRAVVQAARGKMAGASSGDSEHATTS